MALKVVQLSKSDWWEGIQGTASFYPYRTGKEWLSFYGSWRSNTIWNNKMWFGVGLISSPSLEGKWKRLSDLNPIILDPYFVENPEVTKLKNGSYLAIFDTGPENESIGYSFSKDGYNWEKGAYINFPENKPSWRGTLRTPLCFIHENDSIYKIYYTAFNSKGFKHNEEPKHHSGYGTIGLIKVELHL